MDHVNHKESTLYTLGIVPWVHNIYQPTLYDNKGSRKTWYFIQVVYTMWFIAPLILSHLDAMIVERPIAYTFKKYLHVEFLCFLPWFLNLES